MTDAEHGAQLMELVGDAAARGPWMSGRLACEVSFEELAAMMLAGGPERLRFARRMSPMLYTPVGFVRLEPRRDRPVGPFVVTAT